MNKKLKWALLLVPYFVLMVARYPLAIIAVLFFSSEDKKALTAMQWLGTIDQDLSGDSGWKEEHIIGENSLSALNRVRWLWRNGGNYFNYITIGIENNTMWRECHEHTYGYHLYYDGHWLLYKKLPVAGKYFVQCIFGWALFGPQHGRVKYVCTVRIKTKD